MTTLNMEHGIYVPIKVSGNYRLGDIRHSFADISKARSLLKFTPQWDFIKGINEFVKWVNEQGTQTDNYETSIAEMKSKGLYK